MTYTTEGVDVVFIGETTDTKADLLREVAKAAKELGVPRRGLRLFREYTQLCGDDHCGCYTGTVLAARRRDL
jgi:hypothetical protein